MAALQAVQAEVTDSARSCQSEYRLRVDAEARAQRMEHQLSQVGTPLAQAVCSSIMAATNLLNRHYKLLMSL